MIKILFTLLALQAILVQVSSQAEEEQKSRMHDKMVKMLKNRMMAQKLLMALQNGRGGKSSFLEGLDKVVHNISERIQNPQMDEVYKKEVNMLMNVLNELKNNENSKQQREYIQKTGKQISELGEERYKSNQEQNKIGKFMEGFKKYLKTQQGQKDDGSQGDDMNSMKEMFSSVMGKLREGSVENHDLDKYMQNMMSDHTKDRREEGYKGEWRQNHGHHFNWVALVIGLSLLIIMFGVCRYRRNKRRMHKEEEQVSAAYVNQNNSYTIPSMVTETNKI